MDARVFMTVCLLVSERDTAFGQVVWTHVHTHPVTWEDLDIKLPHLPGDVRRDDVPILELDTEHCVSEGFGNGTVLGDRRLFGHFVFSSFRSAYPNYLLQASSLVAS